MSDKFGYMPPMVFVCYSHNQKEFAEKLANDLVENRILVWWDEWEIKVGESLRRKVENGMKNSSYLAVIFSRDSIKSAWVNEELDAAFVKQLEERRVFVLPIIYENVDIPPLFKGKKYADFRKSYSEGLKTLLNSIEILWRSPGGHSKTTEFYYDYAIDLFEKDGLHGFRITSSSSHIVDEYSILCITTVVADQGYSKWLSKMSSSGLEWASKVSLLYKANELISVLDGLLLVEGVMPNIDGYEVEDKSLPIKIKITTNARRLGTYEGKASLFDWKSVFDFAVSSQAQKLLEQSGTEGQEELSHWLESNEYLA